MKLSFYIKQRWYLVLTVIVGAAFSLAVYWADGSPSLQYALQGIGICLVIFFIVDYIILRVRIKNMMRFLNKEKGISFSYPVDKLYAARIQELIEQHNKYRDDMKTQHTNEIEFITKWVHDVKVPISAIKLISDSLEDEPAQQLEMQTQYIQQNIQKILYHIKSKRFHEDYTIKDADVKSIINSSLKQFAVFFSHKKISLDMKCDSFKVATDDKWSEYIVSQIISNAVKYTPEGGKIEISAFKKASKGIITIKNTGKGIDAHNLKNVFNRGFTDSYKRTGASTGYGLYLSKKLADIMGHELRIESCPGEYTSFSLVFNITKM